MLQSSVSLRYYQDDAVNVFTVGGCKNGIIVCPTGAGKSIIISELAKRLNDKNVLVLQPSKEILEQNFTKYSTYSSDSSIYSASLNKRDLNRVTFATIGSVIKLPNSILMEFKVIVVDECHLVGQYGQYAELISLIEPDILIGLTATPYRNNSKFGGIKYEMLTRKMDCIFNTIAYKYEIQDCIKDGFWCNIKYFTPIKYDTKNLETRGSEFKDEAVSQYNFSINLHENIIGIVNNSDKKHFLVFLTTIAECEHTEKILIEAGISCRAIHSKLHKNERDEILHKFKAGEIKVVLNVGVLTTGFDFPELDCLILARPTMSLSLYYQMLGRGVRTHKNKECCDIYDLCGNVESFGRIETLQFVGDNYKRLGLISDKRVLIAPPKSYMNAKMMKAEKFEDVGLVVLQNGKYAGTTIQEVWDTNKGYIQFCIDNNTSFKPIFEKFLAQQQKIAQLLK